MKIFPLITQQQNSKVTKKTTTLIFLLLSINIATAQEGVGWSFWPAAALGPFSGSNLCHGRGTITVQEFDPGPYFLTGSAGPPPVSPEPVGLGSNQLQEGMTGVPNGRGTRFEINYTYPVESVSFIIYDVDGAPGSWQDRIIINPTLGGVATTSNLSCPLGVGLCTYNIAGNIASATTTPSAYPNADGQLVVNIPGPIDNLSIDYLNHTIPTSTTQYIWLDPVIWSCAIVGVSKQMTRRAGQAVGVSPYIVDIDFNFENHGHVNLTNLTSLEDLDAVFNIAPNSGNYTVTSISKLTGPASFTENVGFNGNSNQELIGAGSSLLPTETASIRVTLNVNNYDSYINTVTVDGTTPQLAITSDNSTNGTDPDGSDNDDNPDESTVSTLNTTTLPVSLNYVSTTKNNESLTIEWQTDIEFDHIGFKVYQQDSNGNKKPLSKIIHQTKSQLGQALKIYSETLHIDNNNPVWLAEINTKGVEILYGPFDLDSASGNKIHNTKINWFASGSDHLNNAGPNNNTLEISVNKTGMQRITYSDLIQAGMQFDDVSPNSLAISLEGKLIPIYINGNSSSFDNTTSVDFYANKVESIYTDNRIYKLFLTNKETKKIKPNNSPQSTVVDTWYWQNEHYYPNMIYDFSSPISDPWRAEKLATFGINEKHLQFPLDELFENANQEIQLNIKLSGGIDYVKAPDITPTDPNRCGAESQVEFPTIPMDHCLELTVNNTQYDDLVFDGLTMFTKEYQLDQDVAATGVVDVQLTLPGETGYAHDLVHIEDISITYPRGLTAINNILEFKIADSSIIHNDLIVDISFENPSNNDEASNITDRPPALLIEGFNNSEIVAYALNPENPIRINSTKITNESNGYSISIPAIAISDQYWVSTVDALHKPELSNWHQNQVTTQLEIDYLMIAHGDFIDTANLLKNHHESNGMNVSLINVKDIYSKYSASVIDPLAIKQYIKHIAEKNPLRHILLIGSDNYDYKGYLNSLHFSHIPSIYSEIDDVVRFTPTDSLYADIDNDGVPDIAIGRLPVRTNQELQLLIDKQLNFASQDNQVTTSHFIADSQDSNYSYAQISDQLKDLIPDSWNKLSTNRDDYIDPETTKQNIINNFSQSPRLTTYFGHSGPRNWFSFPSAFTYNDITDLNNSDSTASVIMQWGCWNSYYVEPEANTMAHKFLFSNDKGGGGVFGASALTSVESEKALAQAIIPEIIKQKQTIGQAMLNAKINLSSKGDYRDVILGWNLLGDPAIILNHNK